MIGAATPMPASASTLRRTRSTLRSEARAHTGRPPARERDGEVDLRGLGAQFVQATLVPGEERAPRLRVVVAGVEQAFGVAQVLLGRVGAVHSPQGEVGGQRVGEALKASL